MALALAGVCNLVTLLSDAYRGRHFNTAAREHGRPRTVDTLTVTEIYSLKHETDNRSLHAKLISGLHERPKTLGVQVGFLTAAASWTIPSQVAFLLCPSQPCMGS